ncbi:MAG: hypothetical protein V4696_07400 [Pseudomonadota bacterium]
MAKIPDWALGKHIDADQGVEVRLNDDTTVDEVTASKVDFHLEQMDDGQYWIGLHWRGADGKDCHQSIMLTRHGKHIYPTLYR